MYVDFIYGRDPARPTWRDALDVVDRRRWLEQDIYHALASAQDYAWCYSEQMSWWTGEGVPATAADAIRSAQRKLAHGRPLGFDLSPTLIAAKRRYRAR